MIELTLNIRPLLPQQADLIRLGLRERISRLFLLAGRGSGKSVICIAAAYIAGMRVCKGGRILITYPTYSDARDIGRAKIFEILPPGSFSWKETEMTATLRYTGTQIVLRSRDTKKAATPRDLGRGTTNNLVIHEEPALDRFGDACATYNATVRGENVIGVWYVTTPKIGWLRDEVRKYGLDNAGHGTHVGTATVKDPQTGEPSEVKGAVICYRTVDNVYGGAELHRTMLADYDDKMATQELDGLWISLAGRLWDNFSERQYPLGNMIDAAYNPSLPWALSCDFGVARSSWIVWQRLEVDGAPKHVAVAEYHCCDEGVLESIARIKQDIKERPAKVYSGHDINTRSVVSKALTPAFYIRKAWGQVPLHGLTGAAMDKSIRHAVMRSMTRSATGERRFLVSSTMHSYDPDRRGIMHTIRGDEYQRGETMMAKDGFLEHCRDALHHYMCGVEPPKTQRDRRYML